MEPFNYQADCFSLSWGGCLMKYLNLFSALLLAVSSQVASAAPDRAGDFALLDQKGDFHQLSRYGHSDAVVLFSQSNSWASGNDDLANFKSFKAEWEGQNVSFLMINSTGDDIASIRQVVESQLIEFPVLLDSSQLVAKTLKISKSLNASSKISTNVNKFCLNLK